MELCWLDGMEEKPEDLSSNTCLAFVNAIEWRLGDPGLDRRVGDAEADCLVGESGGVSFGVVLRDPKVNARP